MYARVYDVMKCHDRCMLGFVMKCHVVCLDVLMYIVGFRPNCLTCIAHLYLYYTLLVPHTYASYIRHRCIFFYSRNTIQSFSISNMVSEPLL